MSLHHFLAAPHEIPVGEFGKKPAKIERLPTIHRDVNEEDQYIIHYENEEDFYGIYIDEVDDEIKQIIQTKFTNPFIYEFDGYFFQNENLFHRKCIYTLFAYVKEHLRNGQLMEIYTCLYGEEHKDKNEKRNITINLTTGQFGKNLNFSSLHELSRMIQLEDRQLITVSK